jgi:hypothetical protein
MAINTQDFLTKQQQMMWLANQLQGETDAERIEALGNQLKELAEELEAFGQGMAAQYTKTLPPEGPRATTRVQLTPAQRWRVWVTTGVDIDVLVIDDAAGIMSKVMPSTDPRTIELRAFQEAWKRKAATIVDWQSRASVVQMIAKLEEDASPEMREQIEKIKQDPKIAAILVPPWPGALVPGAK